MNFLCGSQVGLGTKCLLASGIAHQTLVLLGKEEEEGKKGVNKEQRGRKKEGHGRVVTAPALQREDHRLRILIFFFCIYLAFSSQCV